MDAKAGVMLLVGSALEVVERGEFLLGDDASALKGDALAVYTISARYPLPWLQLPPAT